MSLLSNQLENKNTHRFSHHAMATIFEIIIVLDDKDYAEQAAAAVFTEIDRLEDELSRFHPNSDIAKLNSLSIGEELRLSQDAFDSLKAANHIYNITNGIFDITAGNVIDRWKNKEEWDTKKEDDFASQNIGMDKIIIDELNHSLNILSNDLLIDLGGFGKGYAIDVTCELLEEWGIENALIHSGGSTVKGIGNLEGFDGWPISISNPSNPSQTIAEIVLQNNSLSGSGLQKGKHIINPKTNLPVDNCSGAWAIAESAATSDAMSTAFMIMQTDEISDFCSNYDFVSGLVVLKDIDSVTKDDIFISNNFKTNKLLIG